jgi:type II secretory pathway pseudopilin PulG
MVGPGAHSRSRRERGITIIEILVVLGVIALLMLLLPRQLNFLRRGSVRSDASRLAAAIRWGYDRAAATAAHHRLVINLDDNSFVVERCEGKISLVRSIDEAHAQEKQAIAAQLAELPGLSEAVQAGQVQGVPPGGGLFPPPPSATSGATGPGLGQSGDGDVGAGGATLRCAPVKGRAGKPQKLTKEIGKVFVSHLEDPASEGNVTINFFPGGRAERAVVEVADDDNVVSLRLHAMTGRVEIHPGAYRRPDDVVAGKEGAQ